MTSREVTKDIGSQTIDERVSGRESTVTIACIQFEPVVGDVERNRDRSCERIRDAVDRGGDFIVLPELANSGYVFNSRGEAYSSAEPIPSGETARRWIEIAEEEEIYIVGGYAEVDDGVLYNSAVLLGPDGYVGTHRKLHLWNEEKLWFESGDEIEVFDTKIGRIGMQVCYDQWFPEITRIQAQKGVDIVAEPTNWVPITADEQSATLERNELARANHLAISNAHVNTVWFACADRIGVERDQPFLGKSIIVDPTGRSVAGPASQEDEEILIAKDCNLMASRTEKNWNELNVVPRDRRTDLYDELLGYDDTPHPF
ncbi:nitrilase family protein [Natrarchaeobius oligotrophus]|uniref:Hydratase n=1 Tax=Natrarchaeobius chitinivorans TaxID=1679083 RepID=A0A3N6M5V4_NATCH|nr:nitrilase family protein [Natrarchaeobius chitinivorans]RQG97497.1 hydratase [Natrarchaeobius chitinivorans]